MALRFLNSGYFAGKVGIGTDSPERLLSLYSDNAETTPRLLIEQDGTGDAVMAFSLTSGQGWSMGIDNSLGNAFMIHNSAGGVDSSSQLTIATDGDVGIGTVSPYNKTHITTSVDGDGLLLDYAGSNNKYVGVFFKIDNNTSDAYKKGALVWERTGSYNEGRFHFLLNNDDNASNVDLTDSKVTILSTGNVGIGTIDPIGKLEVRSSVVRTSVNGGADELVLQNAGYSGMTILASNTTAAQIHFGDDAMSNTGMIQYWNNTNSMTFSTNGGSEKMRINSAGNVGINTTSPDFKLDVGGTFGVSDLPFNTDSVSVLVANETLGADIVTNGNFTTDTDWSLNTGVTISGGTMNFTSVAGQYGSQNVGFTNGAEYILTFEITAETSGTLTVFLGAGNNIGGVSGVGKKQIFATADSTLDTKLYFGNNFTGSIDNVVLKQVTSASDQIQKRELGTGAFGPTPVGAYLPLAGGTMTGTNGVVLPDNFNLKIGTGSDLQIYHSGTESKINNDVGNLSITNFADDSDIIFSSDNGFGGVTSYLQLDGSHTQTIAWKDIHFVDGIKAKFGDYASPDLQIYHDGSNSYITDSGTGNLRIRSTSLRLENTNSSNMVVANGGGNVTIYYNGSAKFSTINTGIAVTGDIQIDSALLSNQENTDIDTGAEVVAQVAYATYTAAFFDFVVKKGTNVRSGTVYACHNGDTTPLVEFTETSTNDLGDTSDVTLSVDISGTNMRLLATVTSDDWSVKSLIRAI